MKTLTILSIVFFGVASIVYSSSEWNLNELSKADPSAKAWLVQVKGDSVLVHGKQKKSVFSKNIEKNTQESFFDPYPIYKGDIIVTGVKDRATILLRDGSVIWVDSLTVFKVAELNVPSVVPGQSIEKYKVHLKLRVGAVRVRVPKVRTVQKKFSVQTPQGTASVRGTEQVVQYSPGFGLQVNVLSGLVQVEKQGQGVQYASRGEKVTLNTEAGAGAGVQTVNQQRRTAVQKNIQIASGTAPTQTQSIAEEVQIAALSTVITPTAAPAVVVTVPDVPMVRARQQQPPILQIQPPLIPLIAPPPLSAQLQAAINQERTRIQQDLQFVPAAQRQPLQQQLNTIEQQILQFPPIQRQGQTLNLLNNLDQIIDFILNPPS